MKAESHFTHADSRDYGYVGAWEASVTELFVSSGNQAAPSSWGGRRFVYFLGSGDFRRQRPEVLGEGRQAVRWDRLYLV